MWCSINMNKILSALTFSQRLPRNLDQHGNNSSWHWPSKNVWLIIIRNECSINMKKILLAMSFSQSLARNFLKWMRRVSSTRSTWQKTSWPRRSLNGGLVISKMIALCFEHLLYMWCSINMKKSSWPWRSLNGWLEISWNDCIVFLALVAWGMTKIHLGLTFSQRLARNLLKWLRCSINVWLRISLEMNECVVFLAIVEHVMFDQHEQKPLGPDVLSTVGS